MSLTVTDHYWLVIVGGVDCVLTVTDHYWLVIVGGVEGVLTVTDHQWLVIVGGGRGCPNSYRPLMVSYSGWG